MLAQHEIHWKKASGRTISALIPDFQRSLAMSKRVDTRFGATGMAGVSAAQRREEQELLTGDDVDVAATNRPGSILLLLKEHLGRLVGVCSSARELGDRH